MYHKMSLDKIRDIRLKKVRTYVDSSNVDRVMWNDQTFEMVIKFNDGSYYTYFSIDNATFLNVVDGDATCVTDGDSWYVGKSPSVGAAVHKYLSDKTYKKGGDFK